MDGHCVQFFLCNLGTEKKHRTGNTAPLLLLFLPETKPNCQLLTFSKRSFPEEKKFSDDGLFCHSFLLLACVCVMALSLDGPLFFWKKRGEKIRIHFYNMNEYPCIAIIIFSSNNNNINSLEAEE